MLFDIKSKPFTQKTKMNTFLFFLLIFYLNKKRVCPKSGKLSALFFQMIVVSTDDDIISVRQAEA